MSCPYFVDGPDCLCLAVSGGIVPTLRERETLCQREGRGCVVREACDALASPVDWDLYELLLLSPPDGSTCVRYLTHALALVADHERRLRARGASPREVEPLREAARVLAYALDGRPASVPTASPRSRLSPSVEATLEAVERALRWFAHQVDELADRRDEPSRRWRTHASFLRAAAAVGRPREEVAAGA